MSTMKQLKDEKNLILSKLQEMSDSGREFNSAEQKQVDDMFSRVDAINQTLGRAERIDGTLANEYREVKNENDRKAAILANSDIFGDHPQRTKWVDGDGNPVRAVYKGEAWAKPRKHGEPELSLGNIVRAAVTGNRNFAREEFKNAMSGNVDSSGGFLVPEMVSGRVLDLARANSAVTQAGAVFVEMPNETLTMAKVDSDPTFATHSENVTIDESTIGFGAIKFVSRTIATLVRMSRELAEDAPNVGELVEGVLARALAAEIDRQAIAGTGSAQEVGLTIATVGGTTTSVGAIAWEDVHTGVVAVKALNYMPTAYIVHPTIGGDLDVLTGGDGVNASKNWLGAPPSLVGVNRYETTHLSTAYGIIGDFSQCAFGMRTGARIEATTTGGDSFEKHSVLVKATWRGCFRVLQPDAFHRLEGITT